MSPAGNQVVNTFRKQRLVSLSAVSRAFNARALGWSILDGILCHHPFVYVKGLRGTELVAAEFDGEEKLVKLV